MLAWIKQALGSLTAPGESAALGHILMELADHHAPIKRLAPSSIPFVARMKSIQIQTPRLVPTPHGFGASVRLPLLKWFHIACIPRHKG
jgi:hypothetical protein